MVTFDSVSLGSVATYTCDPAFRLMGQPTRTCVRIGANTVWSGQAPTCQGKNACTPEKNKQTNPDLCTRGVISPSTYLHDMFSLIISMSHAIVATTPSFLLIHARSDSVSPTVHRQWDDHHDFEHCRLLGLLPVQFWLRTERTQRQRVYSCRRGGPVVWRRTHLHWLAQLEMVIIYNSKQDEPPNLTLAQIRRI